MSYTEKIDVLDLIIKILNEHEKKLDHLVTRLEIITKTLKQSGPSLPSEEMEENPAVDPDTVGFSKYLEDHR